MCSYNKPSSLCISCSAVVAYWLRDLILNLFCPCLEPNLIRWIWPSMLRIVYGVDFRDVCCAGIFWHIGCVIFLNLCLLWCIFNCEAFVFSTSLMCFSWWMPPYDDFLVCRSFAHIYWRHWALSYNELSFLAYTCAYMFKRSFIAARVDEEKNTNRVNAYAAC